MMKLNSNLYGMIVPHAPTLLEDELDGKDNAVVNALRDSGKRLKEWGVEAVIAVTTHWQTGANFALDAADAHKTVTDYYGFRSEVEYDVAGQRELANRLLAAGAKSLVFPQNAKHGVDHAVTIPLHFMFPERDVPVVPLSVAGSPIDAFRWGRALGGALREWGGKTLLLVSGSLSHDLRTLMTGRSRREHGEFDRQVLDLLSSGNGMAVLELDEKLVELAKPEGAFRDLYILLGALGSTAKGEVKAYEAMPGVGLGVVEFDDSGYSESEEEVLKRMPRGIVH
ncbi:hypothetical protein [Azotosporobacter soli]|uniref:dioxygenase family protein n=1 Tax=Azotosporobacter soli TaxID=3055040 RepID=UPI0031FEAEF8